MERIGRVQWGGGTRGGKLSGHRARARDASTRSLRKLREHESELRGNPQVGTTEVENGLWGTVGGEVALGTVRDNRIRNGEVKSYYPLHVNCRKPLLARCRDAGFSSRPPAMRAAAIEAPLIKTPFGSDDHHKRQAENNLRQTWALRKPVVMVRASGEPMPAALLELIQANACGSDSLRSILRSPPAKPDSVRFIRSSGQ